MIIQHLIYDKLGFVWLLKKLSKGSFFFLHPPFGETQNISKIPLYTKYTFVCKKGLI